MERFRILIGVTFIITTFGLLADAVSQTPDVQYERNPETGRVVFVKNLSPKPLTSTSIRSLDLLSESNAFLRRHSSAFGDFDFDRDFQVKKSRGDDLGMNHFEYTQKINGIPVFATGLKVHMTKDGVVSTVGGRTIDSVDISTTPQVLEDDAITNALKKWESEGRAANPSVTDSEVVIYASQLFSQLSAPPELAWKVSIFHELDRDNQHYFISAMDGRLLNRLPGGTKINRRVQDCSYGDGGCYLDAYSALWNYIFGRSEGMPPRGYTPVLQPTYNIDDTDRIYNRLLSAHLFFQNFFGRNGANGLGGIGNGVHVYPGLTWASSYIDMKGHTNCPNAFFDGMGMVAFCAGLATTDIVGHEYTHALTKYTADLIYQGKSGALNESFSDIFGEVIENYVFGVNDWLVGANSHPASGTPIRDMRDPTRSFDSFWAPTRPSPDRHYSTHYYCGSADNGGVHTNSGVLNHAAYLAAAGGSFNGCSIQGLGVEKMANIFYRTLTYYLFPAAGFGDAYNALLASCGELYSPDDCLELKKALKAVELDQGGACSGIPRVDPGCAAIIDHCPLDGSKAEPGQCGCGVPDIDADGNGILDCFAGVELRSLLNEIAFNLKKVRFPKNAKKLKVVKKRIRQIRSNLLKAQSIALTSQNQIQTISPTNVLGDLTTLSKFVKKALKIKSAKQKQNKRKAIKNLKILIANLV